MPTLDLWEEMDLRDRQFLEAQAIVAPENQNSPDMFLQNVCASFSPTCNLLGLLAELIS